MIKTKNMTRNDIKDIVYDCARNRFGNPNDFDNLILGKSFDGENQLLYPEICFDSLDMIEFIMELEENFAINIDDKFVNNELTLGKVIDYIYDRVDKE